MTENLEKLKSEADDSGVSYLDRYIEFSLGNEGFAIPLLSVRELISIPDTTPIPYSPSHFLGIMNLRGQVISIIDLRKKMKISPNEDQSESAVIIVEIDGICLGMVVDSINKVLEVNQESFCDVPEMESEINTEYIAGVHKSPEALVVLLDLRKILDIKDLNTLKKQAA